MVDYKDKVKEHIRYIDNTIDLLNKALGREEITQIEPAAIGAFIQDIYNGIENILKIILVSRDIRIIKDERWHKELLLTSINEDIIPKDQLDNLSDYLGFRHLFMDTALHSKKINYYTLLIILKMS